MPEQTHKLVHVPDVGVVAFPADLEDDHVKKLIKSFREQKKQKASDVKLDDSFKPLPTEHINLPKTPSRFGGVTTEQTEHARQLKAAQPLSTAIPSLPDWANIPLSTQFEKFEEKHPNVYGLDLERRKQEKQSAAEFAHDFPVAGGVVQGVNQFAEGMTSPANMALMLGAPESKILSGIFAAQAMKGSYGDAQKARKAYEDGNNAEAAQYVTQALLGLGVAGLAGTHAYKGLPEGVRARLASEEGSIGPQGTMLYHGSPQERTELQPGSMLTNTPHWAAGYTTSFDPPRTNERFTGKIHATQIQPEKPLMVEGSLHDAEQRLIDLGKSIGATSGGLKSIAEKVREKLGYDAIIANDKNGNTIGAITLTPRKVHSTIDPVDALYQAKRSGQPIASNLEKILPTDRRTNTELRKRLSEMSPEEMHKLLTTSEVVDLPNKRSFEEDQHFAPMPFVARSDADGLKAFNDKFGYEKGDELLRAKAEALKEAGLNAYHEKGDEFLYRGMSDKELQGRLEKAREILRNKTFDVTLDDGTHVQLKGVDFSYGTGKDLKEAETRQHAHKAEREAAGQRKRGELVGLTEVGPQADSQGQGPAQGGAAAPLAEVKKQAAELKPTTAYQAIDQSQPFYLKSENLINEKMKGPMPAQDLHKMLLSNGVKPEEMQWMGIDDFLKAKGKGKVTPQEMQELLAANNLQIKEVQKGDVKPMRVVPSSDYEGEFDVVDESGRVRFTGRTEHDARTYINEENALQGSRPEGTKFGSYVLPGGNNYRELLLTMPQRMVDSPTARSITYSLPGKEPSGAGAIPQPASLEHIQQMRDRGFMVNDLGPEKIASTEGNFKSGHWDEPNVLGHIRFNDRTGPNGEKILHLEEIQSDWHQKGRSAGYTEPLPKDVPLVATRKGPSWFEVHTASGEFVTNVTEPNATVSEEAAIAEARRRMQHEPDRTYQYRDERVPNAPFKKTWPELMLKRMIKYAADHGYDGISWTPGEEQANRYDLSTQVDNIVVMPKADGSRAVRIHPKNGDSIKLMVDEDGKVENAFQSGAEFGEKNLADIVGKEVAEKILHAPYIDVAKMKAEDKTTVQRNGKDVEVTVDPERQIDHTNSSHIMVKDKEDNRWYVNLSDLGTYHLRGLDLKVGGEGMKGFYDKIIPDAANKLGKQWGAKVGETKIKTDPQSKVTIWDQRDYFQVIDNDDPHGAPLAEFDTLEEAKDYVKRLTKEADEITVPYLPLHAEMKKGLKTAPFSLFVGAGVALSLPAIKQKADDLQKQFRSVGVGR